ERPLVVEAPDRVAEEVADFAPAVPDRPSRDRQPDPDPQLPGRPPGPARHAELEARDRAAGPHHARQLAQRRRGVVDVAEEVREGERVELAVLERQRARVAFAQADLPRRPRERRAPPPLVEHLRRPVDADDEAVLLPDELARDGAGAG